MARAPAILNRPPVGQGRLVNALNLSPTYHQPGRHCKRSLAILNRPPVGQRKLVNARMVFDDPCGKGCCLGHRRWYKEFWEFTEDNVFIHPAGFVSAKICDVERIYAVILQYKASQMREPSPRWFAPEGRYPRGRHTYEGCIHSVMLRSGASRDDVMVFVDEWCRLNTSVLEDLHQAIEREPLANYFS